jgi:hypothetical protein
MITLRRLLEVSAVVAWLALEVGCNSVTGVDKLHVATRGGSPTSSGGLGGMPTGSTGASPTTSGTSTGGSSSSAEQQDCVDLINTYRATLGVPPLTRLTSEESCAEQEAKSDGQWMDEHGSYPMCGEHAQNECPGWQGPPDEMIATCLHAMWLEGPGPFDAHGHYDNMTSTAYTKVACGFYTRPDGAVWATVDFFQ